MAISFIQCHLLNGKWNWLIFKCKCKWKWYAVANKSLNEREYNEHIGEGMVRNDSGCNNN